MSSSPEKGLRMAAAPETTSPNSAVTFGVIGLGYVGLPLAVEAGEAGIRVIGFDVKAPRSRTV